MAGLAIRPSAKIQMIPPNFSIFRMGCLTSAVQQSILWATWEVRICNRTQMLTYRTVLQTSTVTLPTFWCACDGKMLCAYFVSSRLGWSLPCVANTVGCWQAAHEWDIGRGVTLRARSGMICDCGAAMSHGSACSMWLGRTTAVLVIHGLH